MEDMGHLRVIDICAIVVEELINGILEQAFDKSSPGVVHKGNIIAKGALLEEMPVLGETFEGIEPKETGARMEIGLDPPDKGGAARHAKLEIVNRPVLKSFRADDVLMQPDPVTIVPERRIEVLKRHFTAISVNPGGK